MTLDEMKAYGTAMSPWAHVATVGADAQEQRLAPGGAEDSSGSGFMANHPTRATYLVAHGMGGRRTWRPGR